jgi:hypothetical protein
LPLVDVGRVEEKVIATVQRMRSDTDVHVAETGQVHIELCGQCVAGDSQRTIMLRLSQCDVDDGRRSDVFESFGTQLFINDVFPFVQ